MVRSMYSGVTGMKSHQTKLDVIGNNISNVNTYGFKSSRATFRDVYYQSMRNAAAPTATSGGMNPSAVGYGSTISSVDLLMTPSSVTNTGNPMDVAINGDGFFQVEDADGNVFYTRAGMLDIDADGNLVDMNGYYVLGVSGSPVGQAPSSNRINIVDEMGSVPQTKSTIEETINEVKYNITAQNPTTEGNVSFTFVTAEDLPIGMPAEAVVGTSNITIRINSKENFKTIDDLNKVINDAITSANHGKEHPAGKFNITADQNKFPAEGLTGAEICGRNFGYTKGSITAVGTKTVGGVATTVPLWGGFDVVEVGDLFSGNSATAGDVAYTLTHDNTTQEFTLTATVNGLTYTAKIKESDMTESGKVVLRNNAITDMKSDAYSKDIIVMSFPNFNTVKTASDDPDAAVGDQLTFNDITGSGTASHSYPSKDLGLSSRSFKLKNGTLGGAVSVKDLTGIAIGADGVIIANHSIIGEKEVGRIDLANFNNPAALYQSGNSYYATSPNSGAAGLSIPGSAGTGALKTSSLELSNVDLSQEFADLITTQRGYQANSRLITVSDTMLEELVNLKR